MKTKGIKMFITLMQKNTTGIFPKEKFNRGKNLWHIKILQKKKKKPAVLLSTKVKNKNCDKM